ncbi:MAG: alanine racemase [Spirochaetaceae bacterium]
MEVPHRKTRAEIDLEAVEHNIQTLWRRAGEERGYLVLLKADAYGHGNVAVAKLAEKIGLFGGGVAALEEVEHLRENGVTLPLMLLEDLFVDEIGPALERSVSFSVSTYEYAARLSQEAKKMGVSALIHINIDTGMGRLGVRSTEAVEMIEKTAALDGTEIEGIYTHFPSADEGDKSFSIAQIGEFEKVLGECARRGIHPPCIHSANSGALLDFPELSSFTLIRPGVSTFGMYPSPEVDHSVPLREAMTLKSSLIKVSRFPEGVSVGYGRTFVTPRPSTIGVLPIGYGDGYIRDYSNKAEVVVHGMRVPVVGRVSMDMITLDLTDIPEKVELGDEAVLMGTQRWKGRSGSVSSEELARWAGTITYEVTCLIGNRVPRLYYYGEKELGIESLTKKIYPSFK